MASPDGDTGYLVAGKLSHGCSDLSTAWPHGGTGLGLVGAVFLSPPGLTARLAAEETNSAAEVLHLGGDLFVGLTARGWDNDALAALFGSTALSNGARLVSFPATAGVPVTTLTNVVFTPENPDHPGFVVYKVAPVLDLNAQLYFQAARYLEVPAVLVALPDASDRLGKLGKFSELTL